MVLISRGPTEGRIGQQRCFEQETLPKSTDLIRPLRRPILQQTDRHVHTFTIYCLYTTQLSTAVEIPAPDDGTRNPGTLRVLHGAVPYADAAPACRRQPSAIMLESCAVNVPGQQARALQQKVKRRGADYHNRPQTPPPTAPTGALTSCSTRCLHVHAGPCRRSCRRPLCLFQKGVVSRAHSPVGRNQGVGNWSQN